ncbi:MAG: hypothetical protein VX677_09090 [Candidatus Poribacteria bacterium]|nr:hypothetical protein [Candidatus Poribacteria bacterium]
MLIQRSIILLLVMMIVLAECGEGEPEKIKSKEFVDEEPKKRIIWEVDGADSDGILRDRRSF